VVAELQAAQGAIDGYAQALEVAREERDALATTLENGPLPDERENGDAPSPASTGSLPCGGEFGSVDPPERGDCADANLHDWLFVGCPPCFGAAGTTITCAEVPRHPLVPAFDPDFAEVTDMLEFQGYHTVVIHSFHITLFSLSMLELLRPRSGRVIFVWPKDVRLDYERGKLHVSQMGDFQLFDFVVRAGRDFHLRQQLLECAGHCDVDLRRSGASPVACVGVPRHAAWARRELTCKDPEREKLWEKAMGGHRVDIVFGNGLPLNSGRVLTGRLTHYRIDPAQLFAGGVSMTERLVDELVGNPMAGMPAVDVPVEWLQLALAAAAYSPRNAETLKRVLALLKARASSLVKEKLLDPEVSVDYLAPVAYYCMVATVATESATAKRFGLVYRTLRRLELSFNQQLTQEYHPILRLFYRAGLIALPTLAGVVAGSVVCLIPYVGVPVGVGIIGVGVLGSVAVWHGTRPSEKIDTSVVMSCRPRDSGVMGQGVVENRPFLALDGPIGARAGVVPRVPPQRFMSDNFNFNELMVRRVDTAPSGPTFEQVNAYYDTRERLDPFGGCLGEKVLTAMAEDLPELVRPEKGGSWFTPLSSQWWINEQARPRMKRPYQQALDGLGEIGYPRLPPPEKFPTTWDAYTVFIKSEWAIPKNPEDWEDAKPRGITSVNPNLLMADVGVIYSCSLIARWLFRPFHGSGGALVSDCPYKLPWLDEDNASNLLYTPGLVPREMSDWTTHAIHKLNDRFLKAVRDRRVLPPNLFLKTPVEGEEETKEEGELQEHKEEESPLVALRGSVLWARARDFGIEISDEAWEELLNYTLDAPAEDERSRDAFAPVIVCADASSWEYCYSATMMKARKGGVGGIDPAAPDEPRSFNHWLEPLFGAVSDEHREQAAWARKAQRIRSDEMMAGLRKMRGLRGREMFTILREAKDERYVNSGESDTTIGNTMDNLMFYVCMMDICGWPLDHCYVACAGDDSFCVVPRFVARFIAAFLSANFMGFNFKLGENVKIVDPSVDSWEADFCSMRLWPLQGAWEWGPMPERILLKTFHVPVADCTLVERLFYCEEVALGLAQFAQVVPLFNDLINHLAGERRSKQLGYVSAGRRRMLRPDLDSGDWKPSRGATHDCDGVTMQCFFGLYPELARWLLFIKSDAYANFDATLKRDGFVMIPQAVEDELRGRLP